VFDGEGGVLTGKREEVATPVGSWGCPLPACVNKRDREGAWSQAHGRVQDDVARAEWGWLDGGGAREWEQSRLGCARCRALAARVGLVGGTEREYGTRGGLSRGLPEQEEEEEAGVYPWGY
jgi:hypothetical protein